MEAVNYALQHDDGATIRHYDNADVILTEYRDQAKRPRVCIWRCSSHSRDYPITEDSKAPHYPMRCGRIDSGLDSPSIRNNCSRFVRMRPNSRYASLTQCQLEVERRSGCFVSTAFLTWIPHPFRSKRFRPSCCRRRGLSGNSIDEAGGTDACLNLVMKIQSTRPCAARWPHAETVFPM